MMLNLMERFPLGEYGFHSPRALHVMIEAKKLAYADMLRYVGDPRFSTLPVAQLLSKDARGASARRGSTRRKAACEVSPPARRHHRRAGAATRSISRRSTRTATSCR